ncbi:MAG: hypothetical protein JST70_07980 [Bacteroidetes bacterium]|nr:hypothetical protein [Bacteroidota bacterium]
MAMYNVQFGIEAKSQKEAEQKALKFQQIVSEHDPALEVQKDAGQKKALTSFPYTELLGFAACIGLMRLNDWLESRKPKNVERPKEYKNFKHFQFEQRMERRRKEKESQKKNLKAVEVK